MHIKIAAVLGCNNTKFYNREYGAEIFTLKIILL